MPVFTATTVAPENAAAAVVTLPTSAVWEAKLRRGDRRETETDSQTNKKCQRASFIRGSFLFARTMTHIVEPHRPSYAEDAPHRWHCGLRATGHRQHDVRRAVDIVVDRLLRTFISALVPNFAPCSGCGRTAGNGCWSRGPEPMPFWKAMTCHHIISNRYTSPGFISSRTEAVA